MKVFWLLFVFLQSQSEALQRLNWFAKNWRSQIRDEYLKRDLNPRDTIWRLKPKVTKNLLSLKPQDASSATGFKVQGIAQLKNGKVKLDLTVQGANHLGDPSATTARGQTPTPVPGSTATTGAPSSTMKATTSTTVGGPAGSISTLPSSTTAAPTTSAISSGPTSGGATGTTAKPTASTTSATASSGTGPGTSMPSATAPPPTVTAAHVKNAVSTQASVPSTGPSTPSGTTSTPTTLSPSKSSPLTTATVATTGTSSKTTVATMTTSQPSPSQLPGFLSKPFCEKPIDVSTKVVAKEILKSHNDYRQTHAAPPLQLDVQMMCDAQTFAQEIAARGVLQHQKSVILARKRLGENIGMSCAPARGGPLSYGRIMKMAKNVARRWYDEVCQYDFDKPSAVPKTGHFTEIVWSGTKKFGIGFAVGKNARFPEYKCVYVVGRYSPAGNVIGERQLQLNVKRGSFNKSYCQKRSTALQEDPWDKRNHLGPLDKQKRRSHIHSRHHLHHHGSE